MIPVTGVVSDFDFDSLRLQKLWKKMKDKTFTRIDKKLYADSQKKLTLFKTLMQEVPIKIIFLKKPFLYYVIQGRSQKIKKVFIYDGFGMAGAGLRMFEKISLNKEV